MVKRGFHPQEPKGYQPSEQIQNLVEEKLLLLKNNESDRNWDAQKSKILDKMFQSWADLIYFLESIADNPELQDVFEKDLKELFEVKPDSSEKQLSPLFAAESGGLRIKETAFARFVFASLIPHEDEYENFRLNLLNTLQSIVYAKTNWMLTHRVDSNDIVKQSALEDVGKAFRWTYYLNKSNRDYSDAPSRYLDFKAPYKATLRKRRKK